MAELETLTIFKVDTGAAVENIADLKNNIKLLKEQLNSLTIGEKEYQDALKQLELNQTALKDAMHATTADMNDVTKAARGQGESYNALVRQMAKYKEELRAIDTSTEEGMQHFKELAADINRVNLRLKDMDAMQGNYQRNVGDYSQYLSNFYKVVKGLPPSMSAVKHAGDQLDKSFKLMSVNPIIGVVTLIAPLINKIADLEPGVGAGLTGSPW